MIVSIAESVPTEIFFYFIDLDQHKENFNENLNATSELFSNNTDTNKSKCSKENQIEVANNILAENVCSFSEDNEVGFIKLTESFHIFPAECK